MRSRGRWSGRRNVGSFRWCLSPSVLSRGVDGFDKGDDPLVKWPALYRHKSRTDTQHQEDEGEGIFEEKRKGGRPKDDGNDDTGCKHGKLLDGHVTDQAEAVATDVLW